MATDDKYFNGDTFIACPPESKDFDPDSMIRLSKKIFKPTFQKTTFSTIMADGSLSGIINVDLQLESECGKTVNYYKPNQLTGDGVTHCKPLQNHEECPPTDNMQIELGPIRNGVCLEQCGDWSFQRCQYIRNRQRAIENLKTWFAKMILGPSFIHQVTGYTGSRWITYQNSVKLMKPQFSGFNPIYAPSNHFSAGKDDTLTDIVNVPNGEADITSVGTMTVGLVRQISALTVNNPNGDIQPLNENGVRYVMFIHPHQAADLKADPSWTEAMALGDVRGSKNRLFTGALGMVDGILIRTSDDIPNGLNPDGSIISNVRRAVVLGSDAATLLVGGYGMRKRDGRLERVPFDIRTRGEDYDQKRFMSMSLTFGLFKNRFKDKDFSSMVISTYAKNLRYNDTYANKAPIVTDGDGISNQYNENKTIKLKGTK